MRTSNGAGSVSRISQLRTVSLMVGVSVLGWVSVARDWKECTVCGGEDQFGFQETCCSTVDTGGGSGIEGLVRSMNWTERFESGVSWLNWENCATDSNWSVAQYYDGNDNPAPGGGSYAMRLHTGGLNESCSFYGVYAVGNPVTAIAGDAYTFSAYTRNASNAAMMTGTLSGCGLQYLDGRRRLRERRCVELSSVAHENTGAGWHCLRSDSIRFAIAKRVHRRRPRSDYADRKLSKRR